MRNVSQREKELLNKIAKKDKFFIRDLINLEVFKNNAWMEINLLEKTFRLYYINGFEQSDAIYKELVSVYGFVKNLEKNDLVYKFTKEIPLEEKVNIPNNILRPESYVESAFGDKSFAKYVAEDYTTEYYLTEELRQFIKAGFKTPEQKRHIILVWLTVLGLLVAILGTIVSNCNSNVSYEKLTQKINSLDIEGMDRNKTQDSSEVEIINIDSLTNYRNEPK